jgi:hypothetical protein
MSDKDTQLWQTTERIRLSPRRRFVVAVSIGRLDLESSIAFPLKGFEASEATAPHPNQRCGLWYLRSKMVSVTLSVVFGKELIVFSVPIRGTVISDADYFTSYAIWNLNELLAVQTDGYLLIRANGPFSVTGSIGTRDGATLAQLPGIR